MKELFNEVIVCIKSLFRLLYIEIKSLFNKNEDNRK